MKNFAKLNNKRIIASLLSALCLALLLSGCQTYSSFKRTFIDEKTEAQDNVIYIGVFEPRSGELSTQGNDEVKGIELANKIYGNIKGTKIELIIMDNQSATGPAKAAISDLIEMKPVLIIGSAGEANSLIASPYIKEAGIPMITPSATNPLITRSNPFFFRACITDTQRGAGLAEYAYEELGSRAIGIVNIRNDSYGHMLTDGFENKLTELSDGEADPVRFKASVSADGSDIENVINTINRTGVDVVALAVGLEKADLIFTMAEEAGRTDITFLGEANWAGSDFAAMMEKHPNIKAVFPSDKVAAETSTTENSVTDETERFRIEYAKTYGMNDIPSDNAALAYDSYLLAINAINRAVSTDPKAIRDALANIKGLRCTTGVFSFDDNGNPVREVNILTHENGEVKLLYTSERTESDEDIQIESDILTPAAEPDSAPQPGTAVTDSSGEKSGAEENSANGDGEESEDDEDDE